MNPRPSFSLPLPGIRWRRGVVALAFGGVLFAANLAAPFSTPRSVAAGPAPLGAGAAINADALDAMLAQLKRQQEQMTANQTKVETQLAALKEELRLTKIYSSRAGAGGRR